MHDAFQIFRMRHKCSIPTKNLPWRSDIYLDLQILKKTKMSDMSHSVCYFCVPIYIYIPNLIFKYVFFIVVLFPRHFAKGDVRDATISQIQLFRDYLHYHIKCSKAYMHSRMRARVQAFLKVLNRAKPDPVVVEKKTIS